MFKALAQLILSACLGLGLASTVSGDVHTSLEQAGNKVEQASTQPCGLATQTANVPGETVSVNPAINVSANAGVGTSASDNSGGNSSVSANPAINISANVGLSTSDSAKVGGNSLTSGKPAVNVLTNALVSTSDSAKVSGNSDLNGSQAGFKLGVAVNGQVGSSGQLTNGGLSLLDILSGACGCR